MITGKKCFLLALQCFVLLIGSLIVFLIVDARDSQSNKVTREISEGWGPSQIVDGPYITIDGTDKHYFPNNFVCDAKVSTQTLHKGIYSTVVYTTEVNLTAQYKPLFTKGKHQRVKIQIELQPTYFQDLGNLVINGKKYSWDIDAYNISKTFSSEELTGKLEISTSFTILGSQRLRIYEVGDCSKVIISGEAKDPSFGDGPLPISRHLTEDTFEAEWVSDNKGHYGNQLVGVEFLTGLDNYKKVARCLKYAILIILFTYCSVIFTEIMTKRNVPLLNYFLIGVALIIFYTLLLSFSEWMSFFWSYFLASVMIIAMISLYMYKITDSKRVGKLIALILGVIYIGCYVMLISSTYALLLGSLALFGALSALMYASLRMTKNQTNLNS